MKTQYHYQYYHYITLLCLLVKSFEFGRIHAFPVVHSTRPRIIVPTTTTTTTIHQAVIRDYDDEKEIVNESQQIEMERKECFYKSPLTQRWRNRLELSELVIGQKLEDAVVVQEKLNGQTGPKVWVDCGIGRYKASKQNWIIQTAMLRLGGFNMKDSVAIKKAARLRKKKHFPVYVSRIRLENDQLEVSLEEPTSTSASTSSKSSLVSVSSLSVGKEMSGIIQRVEDYGILLDVGANRLGLLHIRRVGDLYHKFINKAAGLKKVGLTKGVQVDVQVISCDKKRLFLDFSESIKQEAERKYKAVQLQNDDNDDYYDDDDDPYAEEAALFAAQQHNQPTTEQSVGVSVDNDDDFDDDEYDDDDDEYEDDDEDDYDEDREIEDAMGLGRY